MFDFFIWRAGLEGYSPEAFPKSVRTYTLEAPFCFRMQLHSETVAPVVNTSSNKRICFPLIFFL